MANSADETTSSKCFSGLLSRLLCSGSLPTHPSDQFTDPNNIEKLCEKNTEKSIKYHGADKKQGAAAEISTPGVVARLMGLESFPNTPLAPKDKTLGSYFRSRSVNSIDFLSHFDPVKQGQHYQHRRVRTSVSFREGINDEDYTNVILRLEKVDETAECTKPELLIRRRRRSPDVNLQLSKMEKRDNIRNCKKLQEKRVANKPSTKRVEMMNYQKKSSPQKMDLHGKTGHKLNETRPIMNSKEELRKNTKCLKTKMNLVQGQRVHSGCNIKKVHPQEVCSRNNVASSEIGKSNRSPYSSGAANSSYNGEIRGIIKGKNERRITKSKESCYYKRMAEEICRLANEDVKANWMHNQVALGFEYYEDMCQQFGQEILQVLVKQFVDELVYS